ncbi:hypothetical protein Drorol1_Dr00005062 [Drosera rotundifolia]
MILHSIAKSSRRLCSLSLALSKFAHKKTYSHFPIPSPLLSSSSFSHCTVMNLNSRFYSSNRSNGDGNDDKKSSLGVWKLTSENDDIVKSLFDKDGGDLTGSGGSNTHRELKRKTWALQSDDIGEGNIFEGLDKDFVDEGGDSTGALSKDNGDWMGVAEGGTEGEWKGKDSSWDFRSGGSADVNVFDGVDTKFEKSGSTASRGSDEWLTADGYKPWSFDEEENVPNVLDIGEVEKLKEIDDAIKAADEERKKAEKKALENEEKALTAVLKGPNRAFGDLVAASGISDAMLDSLMALKNFQDIEGLPPLRDIEDERYEKTKKKSVWGEIERQKQEAITKSRVRVVDEKGRAYGTGRRKCSIARVWIQPGDGKFSINDKEFDIYFPLLDHRAALLRPFSETNTLGLWDVNCTVKGGGTTGQVGAIQLGISRALQHWEPELRPPLKQAGFFTRDPRVVERKKPGKAKARKSFQWVKR